jgi:hypothetical protein
MCPREPILDTPRNLNTGLMSQSLPFMTRDAWLADRRMLKSSIMEKDMSALSAKSIYRHPMGSQ